MHLFIFEGSFNIEAKPPHHKMWKNGSRIQGILSKEHKTLINGGIQKFLDHKGIKVVNRISMNP
jgi:hypothetical protein